LTFGFYEKFPANIHRVERFRSILTNGQLQQRLIQVFYEINRKEFSFEEVANPTIPECKIVFEFGLADAEGFSYIDEEETKKALNALSKEKLNAIDFFCGIRYHKSNADKKKPLKFDYYILRTVFNRGKIEIQVHHERGPRYISPEDLTLFISNQINEGSNRKVLKKSNSEV
jgi:hypothetical protein